MKRVFLFSLCLVVSVFLFVPATQAATIAEQYADMRDQGIIFAGICDNSYDACACRDTGDCELNDILQLLVNISSFILAISGSALLLIFVYGGMNWILAHGDTAMVDKGRKALLGGLIGMAIIFGSYAAINVVVSVLLTGDVGTTPLEDTIDTNIPDSSAGDIITTQ